MTLFQQAVADISRLYRQRISRAFVPFEVTAYFKANTIGNTSAFMKSLITTKGGYTSQKTTAITDKIGLDFMDHARLLLSLHDEDPAEFAKVAEGLGIGQRKADYLVVCCQTNANQSQKPLP
ncbi:hypothetical protein [Pararhodobacter sp. SW119]|uniref:hypothetical protein n=1 Tax=Pararhodobacter sp. SW119 TaxID=2780075 RepID=UPI001ADEC407|nr:hypothetical protein [Pararhodobacter sp. SW119]